MGKAQMDQISRAYYAVIAADVRYDKTLKPNAKLLYAELTALCNQYGYCWATNEWANEHFITKNFAEAQSALKGEET